MLKKLVGHFIGIYAPKFPRLCKYNDALENACEYW